MSRPRLLILRALGLGDTLTGVPALRALARAFPDHERVLAAPAHLAPLVALADAVDRVVDVAEMAPLPVELHGVEVAVNLHGRGPQSHRILLDARPRATVWFRHPEVPESAAGPEWRAEEHEVARWCRMLAAHGIPADPANLRLRPPGGDPAWPAGATVIHPGAASPARRWPPERFAAIARAERGHGNDVVITGSEEERALGLAVAAAAGLPADAVVAGRTDLTALAAGIAHTGRGVWGDTGVAHLATAFGVPSVVLFGPTPPARWGPPEHPWHRVVWAGHSGDPHGRVVDPGLLEVTVERVLGELASLPVRATA